MTFFQYLCETFGVENPGQVKWSHAVNSEAKLSRIILDVAVMVVETDIQINTRGEIVCAHSPEIDSDLGLEMLLNKISQTNKALKLDFKNPEAVIRSLKMIKAAKISNAILVNADVLKGNGANEPKFDPHEFINACKREILEANLSLGWTSVANDNYPYEMKEVREMLKIVGNENSVTFPVRACLLPNSWSALKYLLDQNNTWTLSVWNNEPLDDALII